MKNAIKIIMSGVMVFMLIFYTEQVTKGANLSLEICATSVIPALFPFFVVSGILVNTGISHLIGEIFTPVSKLLFKTSGTGAFCFVMGLLCGYPTGAKVIADMYKSGTLSKKESERLLAFCNNSGPLFVIGTVGISMLGNKKIGIVLYVIHAISALFTGVMLSLFNKKASTQILNKIVAVNLGRAITKSIEDAVKSILMVCGYVVFFGSVISLAQNFLKNPFILSLLEVTTGAKMITSSGVEEKMMLSLLSGSMAFGGICVFLQVKSVIADTDLSARTYMLGKSFQAICAFIITKVYFSLNDSIYTFSPQSQDAVSSYLPLVLFVVLSILVLISSLTKRS